MPSVLRFRTWVFSVGAAVLFVMLGMSIPAQGQPSITGGKVSCEEGMAQGYPCRNVDLLSFLNTSALGGSASVDINDLWGWTDPVTGTEYALVGRSDGTAFVDLSDPENPVYLGELPTHTDPSPWRDLKVYADHVFIVSEAEDHGLQVFDLTQLRDVSDPPVTFSETAHYDRFGQAHNVAVNPSTGYAYAVGITDHTHESEASAKTDCDGSVQIIDIRDPAQPEFVSCYSSEVGDGYTHDAQCVTYNGPDEEHQGKEICMGADEVGLSIMDVTDKQAPVQIAGASYPEVGYAHQGWFGENHRYFYLGDELDERNANMQTRTIVWDLADLDNPEVATEYFASTDVIDHNLYARGDSLYQANYEAGLRILDITDPSQPKEVGFFDTYPNGNGIRFNGAWSTYPFFDSGIVVVSSIGEGLFVLKPKPAPLIELAETTVETQGRSVILSWRTLSERGAGQFVVQRRYDREMSQWETITTIEGRGTLTEGDRYTFRVNELGLGTYQFRIKYRAEGREVVLDEGREVEITVPNRYDVTGPYPNPTQSQSRISLVVKEQQQVRVAIYDAQGRRVRWLHQGPLTAEVSHPFALDVSRLASGAYFWRIEGESFTETQPFRVVR